MTKTQLDFSDVLDLCIEDVKAGRLTVEECLDRYPEFAHELRDPLMVAETLRGLPLREPSEAFRQQARPQLMSQLGPLPAGRVSLLEMLREKWTSFFFIPQTRRFSMGWMLALLLVGSVLVGGGTAYASDAAVPGQALYGLDRSLEEIQSGLTSDPEAFVALQLAFADERLSEAQELAGKAEGKGFQEALDGYAESIAAIAQEVGSAEGIDLEALSILLDEALSNQDAKLSALSLLDEGEGTDDCNVNSNGEDCDENGNEDNGNQDGDMVDGDKSDNSFCFNNGTHPVALKLEEKFDGLYDSKTIMDWFCGTDEDLPGFGFGQIMHAIQTEKLLETSDTPLSAADLLAMKASGMGWGQIWQDKGLKGKPVVEDPEDSELSEDDLRPEPPGQAKKTDQQEPPGQAKKTDQQVPPGQLKKTEGQEPPGQAKKSEQEEPSEETEDTDQPESPDQDGKSDQSVPPGQAKKSGQQEPPGQAKKPDQQQGKKNKNK